MRKRDISIMGGVIVFVIAVLLGMALLVGNMHRWYQVRVPFAVAVQHNRAYLEAANGIIDESRRWHAYTKKTPQKSWSIFRFKRIPHTQVTQQGGYPVWTAHIPLGGETCKQVEYDEAPISPRVSYWKTPILQRCQDLTKNGACMGYSYDSHRNGDRMTPGTLQDWHISVHCGRQFIMIRKYGAVFFGPALESSLHQAGMLVFSLTHAMDYSVIQQQHLHFSRFNRLLHRPLYPVSLPDVGHHFHFFYGANDTLYLGVHVQSHALIKRAVEYFGYETTEEMGANRRGGHWLLFREQD
ncbi:hypothetical protein RU820_05000 [Acidithiobacillus ferrooxidans]|uniref:Uncharacterized protein n=1 Tax=Acidithiobacillus ferrooxidans (strain ATCC 23270 / DSM 14882 / CIP 104768 / NCIMB 8455) TaxID=243159 RepID=B7J802_ACIF2|nr:MULTISPECIES: hypothetical protein [Acidithiobacillus]ACK79551.1 hypothetical protein AFE_1054 [Acidithiobacillus ferrooxidans ATCC 23270]MBN6744216.1 hypothetical protein [Acidithiobacillus sp. MC2.2]MBN6746926.1 hypothetical protein [Acidithiobacillus sp. PG05]